MKIGITGASGHAGANLSRALLQKGYSLRLSVHRFSRSLEQLPAEKIAVNITDYVEVENFIRGCDCIIHLAAKISIDGDVKGVVSDTNLQGTKNVIRACEKLGTKKCIHFSSIHTLDPNPLTEILNENRPYVSHHHSPYELSKILAEKEVLKAKERGLNAIIIVPTSLFGPYDYYPSLLGKAMLDIYHRQIPALVHGGYDFVFAEDLVKGVITIIENEVPSEKYIFNGTYVSIQNLAEVIGEVCNKNLKYPIIPFGLIKIALPFFQLHSFFTNKPALFTKESMHILQKSPQKISSALAQKELGYTITPFKNALTTTFDWYSSEGMLNDKR